MQTKAVLQIPEEAHDADRRDKHGAFEATGSGSSAGHGMGYWQSQTEAAMSVTPTSPSLTTAAECFLLLASRPSILTFSITLMTGTDRCYSRADSESSLDGETQGRPRVCSVARVLLTLSFACQVVPSATSATDSFHGHSVRRQGPPQLSTIQFNSIQRDLGVLSILSSARMATHSLTDKQQRRCLWKLDLLLMPILTV